MTIYLPLFVGIVAAAIHLFIRRKTLDRRTASVLMMKYGLAFCVGFAGIFGAMGHLLRPDEVARSIGWQTGSPFQFEVGVHDLAWGFLGLIGLRYGRQFWLAVITGWSVFMFGAAFGHIRETLSQGNFAPYNFGMILPDILIPLVLISLYLHHVHVENYVPRTTLTFSR
jgi:hypothetical protein